jgi:hypothetical protein
MAGPVLSTGPTTGPEDGLLGTDSATAGQAGVGAGGKARLAKWVRLRWVLMAITVVVVLLASVGIADQRQRLEVARTRQDVSRVLQACMADVLRAVQLAATAILASAAGLEAAPPLTYDAFHRTALWSVRAAGSAEDMYLLRVLPHWQRPQYEAAMAAALQRPNFTITDRYARGADGLWTPTAGATPSPERPLYLVVEAMQSGMNGSAVGADMGFAHDENATTLVASLGRLSITTTPRGGITRTNMPPRAVPSGFAWVYGIASPAAAPASQGDGSGGGNASLPFNPSYVAWPEAGQALRPSPPLPLLTLAPGAGITHLLLASVGPGLFSRYVNLAIGGAWRRLRVCACARVCVWAMGVFPCGNLPPPQRGSHHPAPPSLPFPHSSNGARHHRHLARPGGGGCVSACGAGCRPRPPYGCGAGARPHHRNAGGGGAAGGGM